MNRRTRSHLPVSPMATSSPRTSETARTSRRHVNGEAADPYDLNEGPGNARTVADPGSNGAGIGSGRFDANRNANIALAQRSKVETAKTTTKRAAFVANIVQKTPTYPIDENHAQSTTMLQKRASAKRKAIAAISTPMRLEGMLSPSRRSRQRPTAASVLPSAGVRAAARAVVRWNLPLGPTFSRCKGPTRRRRRRRRRLLGRCTRIVQPRPRWRLALLAMTTQPARTLI